MGGCKQLGAARYGWPLRVHGCIGCSGWSCYWGRPGEGKGAGSLARLDVGPAWEVDRPGKPVGVLGRKLA